MDQKTVGDVVMKDFRRNASPTPLIKLIFVFLAFSSCVHEPVVDPADPPGQVPDPQDPVIPGDTTGNNSPCDPEVVYFNMQILPLLKSNCAKSGCHDAITHEEDIVLDSYENVMGSDVIKPFDADDSDLFEVITEDDPDKIMPPPPNQRLSAEQISLIASWIDQGAKDISCEDSGVECNTDNVTYSGYVAPLLTTYCVGCHSGGAPSGGIALNTYNGVSTVAKNGRLFGAISHAAGFQPMPRGSARLPQCTIDKIKAWIDDGSPDN